MQPDIPRSACSGSDWGQPDDVSAPRSSQDSLTSPTTAASVQWLGAHKSDRRLRRRDLASIPSLLNKGSREGKGEWALPLHTRRHHFPRRAAPAAAVSSLLRCPPSDFGVSRRYYYYRPNHTFFLLLLHPLSHYVHYM